MPRLFAGLEIPPSVGQALSWLRGGLPGARWIEPTDYHITLRFVGDIDDRTAFELVHALDRVERTEFDVRLAGIDVFGADKPHSVFARVEPTPEIRELQADLERLCQRLGLKPEPRKFTPHVTLARLRRSNPADVASWLSLRGGFTCPPFRVEQFALFSARDSVGGGPYLVEETYPLRAW